MVKIANKRHFCCVQSGKDTKYLKDFGRNLRRLRIKKGISQEALAIEAGIGKNQVGVIERGEVNVTINTIKKLAKHIGVHPKDLLDF